MKLNFWNEIIIMKEKYYIYKSIETDIQNGITFESLRYYKKEVKDASLIFVGTCEVVPSDYFLCEEGQYKHIMEPTSYNRKDIAKRAVQARKDNDLELSGMLEWLIQLRFSWIRQIKDRFLEPDKGGNYFPHKCKIKDELKHNKII